jgi:hypothetical protein
MESVGSGIFAQRASEGLKNKHKKDQRPHALTDFVSEWKYFDACAFEKSRHLIIFKRDFTVA